MDDESLYRMTSTLWPCPVDATQSGTTVTVQFSCISLCSCWEFARAWRSAGCMCAASSWPRCGWHTRRAGCCSPGTRDTRPSASGGQRPRDRSFVPGEQPLLRNAVGRVESVRARCGGEEATHPTQTLNMHQPAICVRHTGASVQPANSCSCAVSHRSCAPPGASHPQTMLQRTETFACATA